MKIILKHIRTILFVAIITVSYSSFAQPPDPPGGASGSTRTDDNRNGGRAPIGSGLLILLGLGSIYGGYKGYQLYQKKKKSLLD